MAFFAVVIWFLGCGANQLRIAEANIQDISTKVESQRRYIESACAVLDTATDRKVELCAEAVTTYADLADTLHSLGDAIRAADGQEDPNVTNIVELLNRAVILERDLALILEDLAGTS